MAHLVGRRWLPARAQPWLLHPLIGAGARRPRRPGKLQGRWLHLLRRRWWLRAGCRRGARGAPAAGECPGAAPRPRHRQQSPARHRRAFGTHQVDTLGRQRCPNSEASETVTFCYVMPRKAAPLVDGPLDIVRHIHDNAVWQQHGCMLPRGLQAMTSKSSITCSLLAFHRCCASHDRASAADMASNDARR